MTNISRTFIAPGSLTDLPDLPKPPAPPPLRRDADNRSSTARPSGPPAPPISSEAAQAREARLRASLANDAGIGTNLEELTFGASEREEVEVHGENQDAYEREVDETARLLPVEQVRELMRQLEGREGYAALAARAQQFAKLWRQGFHQQALSMLDAGRMDPPLRLALMRMARDRMPEGAAAEDLDERLRNFETDAVHQMRKLIDAVVVKAPTGAGADASAASAPNSPLAALTASQPSVKLVNGTAMGMGPDGLDKLQTLALRRGRAEGGMPPIAAVGMSMALLRMIGQLRDAQRCGTRLAKAGGAAEPGAEDMKKVVNWLLDLCSTAPSGMRGALKKMGTAIPAPASSWLPMCTQLQRELHQLPVGLWSGPEAKESLSDLLGMELGVEALAQGRLDRTGQVDIARRWASVKLAASPPVISDHPANSG